MVGSTVNGFDAFLKDNYTGDEIARTVNEDHFFLDDLDTKSRGTGRRKIVPLIDGNPQGLAPTVVTAQLGAEGVQPGANIIGAAWTISWGDYVGHVDIGDKVIDASASDMGAFFEDMKEEIDGIYRAFADTMSSYLLRGPGHALGQASNLAAGVITLATASDIVNFERGQILVQSAGDGSTSSDTLLGPGTLGFVFAVNYNSGVLSVATTAALALAGTAGSPTNWTSTGFLFRDGDFGATAYAGAGSAPAFTRIVLGYGAWNPATDPTATLFEGVDRSVNIIRRSGARLTSAECSGLGIEQRLKRLAVRMSSRAKKAKKGLVHPEQWQALADSLETKGLRNITSTDEVGVFNFESIKLNTPAGAIPIYSDKFMDPLAAYLYDPKGIRMQTLSGFPKVVNGDGMSMLRKATENTFEYRIAAYPAYWHRDPAMTGRCPLLTPT